jgi:FkbM family methyltransferase
MKKIKKIIRSAVQKSTGFDLSTIRTSVGDDFLDQKALCKKGGAITIFDVGANVGQTTMKYRKIFPRAQIYGFEPFRDVYNTYAESFSGDRKVHTENLALSNKNGTADFFLNSTHYTNSLLPNNEEYTEGKIGYEPIASVQVPTKTLDSFCADRKIEAIDILKMDVQGGELMVLEGAKSMLAAGKISMIFTEVEFQPVYKEQPLMKDIESFLNQYGFDLYKIYNVGEENGAPLAGDALFINKKHYKNYIMETSNRGLIFRGLKAINNKVAEAIDPHVKTHTTDRTRPEIILSFLKKYPRNIFIETGTYEGDTTYGVKDNFKKLYSIELSEMLYKRSVERFLQYPHVQLLQGDSGQIIPKILSELKEPAIFYLDGHFSGGLTVKTDVNTPIWEELSAILEHPIKDHIILIDDARLFVGEKGYPTVKELLDLIQKSGQKKSFEIEDDLISIVPAVAGKEINEDTWKKYRGTARERLSRKYRKMKPLVKKALGYKK